ncbi:unnamed protein product [Dovyalis caffra]|uniref:Uncharacterized protein n=1 Tax=Dovyalis caffra TaxID=77055 RepID=A0AAV1SMF7_9ROSI|nr:unnamed protein product [Dovyalis caffra]
MWGVEGFDPFVPRGIASHHIVARTLDILTSLFHLSVRSPQPLYKGLRMGNIENMLFSSITVIFFAAFVVAGTMCKKYIEELVLGWLKDQSLSEAWSRIPEKLAFYDYIENNLAKGGLFGAGSMDNEDEIAMRWLGHPIFRDKEGCELFIRRIPTFFETFPVVLVDEDDIVRADVPFRRAESKYSVEQIGVIIEFYGGELNGVSYTRSCYYEKIS